jgi:methyl-accepting chemotaxis protein
MSFIQEAVKKSEFDLEKAVELNTNAIQHMERIQESMLQTGAACKQVTEKVANLVSGIVTLSGAYQAKLTNEHAKALAELGAKVANVDGRSAKVAEEILALAKRIDRSSQFAADQAATIGSLEAALRSVEKKVK